MEFENGNGMDVGGLLRASRMRRNEGLSDVAQILRIRMVYMEAIEEGRFDDLPGNTYAIGFIRSYSEHLGLDGDEIIRRFKSEASDGENSQSLSFPTVVPENGIPRGAIVMVGLLIAVFGYGSWYVVSTQDSFTTESVAPVPAQIAKAVNELSPQSDPVIKIEPSSAAAAAPVQPLTRNEPSSDSPEPQTATEIPAVEPSEPGEPAVEAARAPESVQPLQATPNRDAPAPAPTVAMPPAAPVEAVVERAANLSSAPAPEIAPEIAPENTPSVAAEPEASGENQAVKPDPVQSSFDDVVPGGVSAGATAPARAKIAAAPPQIPAVPQVEAADNGLVDLTEAPDATDPAEKPVVSEAPIEAPLVRDTVDNVETPVEPPVEPVEVATAAAVAKSRITVRAAGVSWIQIRDNAANELLVMKLLQRGQSYDVPNQKDLSMGTGNAGVLVITVDGVEVPAVGPVGAVRRNILLDVDRLRNGTAVIK